jgi:hypothetical protein
MYKLLFTGYIENEDLITINDNDIFTQIDDDFYLFDSEKINIDDTKFDIWDIKYFAKMSFNTYEKENEMKKFIIETLTQQKLGEIFNADNPKVEFQTIIDEVFKI